MSDAVVEAQALLDGLKMGDISCSYYDMAWVLRSEALSNLDQQDLLNKILKGQREDGSWGGELGYFHDRVINTLSVVVALNELFISKDSSNRGVGYLQAHIPRLREESIETIGFELTFPSLLKDAQKYNLNLPYSSKVVGYYQQLGQKKKELLPEELFAKPSTILHSLEAFCHDDLEFSNEMVFENGSVGNSPAATAFYVKKVGKENALKSVEYLRQFIELDWEIPSIYPFEIFEKAWVLYNCL